MQASTARALPPRGCSPTSSGCCCSHSGAIQSTRREEKVKKYILWNINYFFGNWQDVADLPYNSTCVSELPADHPSDFKTLSECIVETLYNTSCIQVFHTYLNQIMWKRILFFFCEIPSRRSSTPPTLAPSPPRTSTSASSTMTRDSGEWKH